MNRLYEIVTGAMNPVTQLCNLKASVCNFPQKPIKINEKI